MASNAGEPGLTIGGEGGAPEGDSSAGAGVSGADGDAGPSLPTLLVDVAEPLFPIAASRQLLPFQNDGVPYYIAYSAGTGMVSFRGIARDRRSTSAVWEGQWEAGFTAIVRLAPAGKERFAYYRVADGLRILSTFGNYLQDRYILNYDQTELEPGYTHSTADVPPTLGAPLLYWYNEHTGNLRVDMLRSDDGRLSGGFTSFLRPDYRALVAVDGHLLGIQHSEMDVYDLSALAGGTPPGRVSNLPPSERVLAFHMNELSLLVCYSLVGNARILRLTWTDDGARAETLWEGPLIEDATSLRGLELAGEYLLFIHDAPGAKLQLVSITRGSLQ